MKSKVSKVSNRLDKRVRVREAQGRGKGVFAARVLMDEFVVGQIHGRIIDDPDHDSRYCIDLDGRRLLEPFAPFRFLNHCCTPNCQIIYYEEEDDDKEDRRLFLQTNRKILPGEELTIDYGWSADAAIPCLCGVPECRGWIVDRDQLPELLASLAAEEAAKPSS